MKIGIQIVTSRKKSSIPSRNPALKLIRLYQDLDKWGLMGMDSVISTRVGALERREIRKSHSYSLLFAHLGAVS